jgi:hypothetical protein
MLGNHPHHPLTHRGIDLLRHVHILQDSKRCGIKPGALHRRHLHRRQVKPPAQRVTVPLGARVTLKVTSDVADEVHVHGYDHFADLKPKRTTTLSFKATSPGLYEVEAEAAGTLLVQLLVR